MFTVRNWAAADMDAEAAIDALVDAQNSLDDAIVFLRRMCGYVYGTPPHVAASIAKLESLGKRLAAVFPLVEDWDKEFERPAQ